MDWYTRKIIYLWLIFSETSVNTILFFYSIVYSKKNKKNKLISIAAFWYYPPDLTGSNLRIGGWQQYFEKEKIVFENYFLNTLNEYISNIENGSWTKKYFYFSLCLWRRLPQLLQSHKYDVLWIDRSLIPFYPRKTAFIEECVKKVVQRVVVDSTDGGDYLCNKSLMEGVYQSADRITVGYKYLLETFEKKYQNVSQVFWTIPDKNYIRKEDYSIHKKPIIGWMGNPQNFKEVLKIKEQLLKTYEHQQFVFRYICRKNFDKELEGLEVEHFEFGPNYYELIHSFDIGICPFIVQNMRTMGKIAMKHQEFLLVGVPQVCSSVAISEFVKHEKHVLIAEKREDWKKCLSKLLTSKELRTEIGNRSKNLFLEHYQYDSQYLKLKKALIE